jgi:hypothetical protein
MKYVVLLSSEEFGNEFFHYDTVSEAREGFLRLWQSAEDMMAADGIEREVFYLGAVMHPRPADFVIGNESWVMGL